MKPKLIAASIAAALVGHSVPLYAGPLDKNEVKAMAYVSLPFSGASRRQEAPLLGFALNHTQRVQGDGFSYHPALFQQTPMSAVRSLVDIRYDTRKANWQRFRVGGVDALTYRTRMNADGTVEAEAAGISTGAIVAGAVVGAIVVHKIVQDRKEDQPSSTGGPIVN